MKLSIKEVSYVTLQGGYSKQGDHFETIAGAIYSREIGEDCTNPAYTVHFGGYLRSNDAFIPVIKLDYTPFSIALSYDINISALKTASQYRRGFEASFTYAGFLDRNNSTKNAVLCPKF